MQTVTDQIAATTGATANSFEATSDGGDADMRINQYSAAGVATHTVLNVGANSGAVTSLATVSTGNSGYAGVTGATMTGVYTQSTTNGPITSVSHIEAPHAVGGDVAASSQAFGNAQTLTASAAAVGLRVNQSNAVQTNADGGGVYGLVTGTAQYDAASIGNNVGYGGDSWSGARLAIWQNNATDLTQAAQFTAFGQVQDGKTTATATGNNTSAVNNGYILDANVQQYNQAYVRAQAETSAFSFGAVSSTASGVGNNALLGDIGGEVIVDNTQVNEGGGIDVLASTTGQDGYDGQASASAIGNSVTGYACAECDGRMTVNNNQTNTAEVGSSATTTFTGTVRSATGYSTAVGNSATYYVSRPSGQ